MFSAKRIARTAIIAALYAALALALNPVAFGPVQFRLSEALVLLPLLMPEAVLGVTLGCLITNFFSPFGVWDIVFGTLITFAAAWLSRLLKKAPPLATLPPILLNAFFIPMIILWAGGEEGSYWGTFASILVSQVIAAGVLALILFYALRPIKKLYS